MNLHVWGPVSVRHNDLYTLVNSEIEEKLENLQINMPFQYKMYGDSAYHDSRYLVTGGGRGMSSVRECIEWDYQHLKTQWKYMDYKHVLKLRNQPVGKIVFVCMLLRNAHCSMNASQTSEYFSLKPPSFEDWVSAGPRAYPIPEDNPIFMVRENPNTTREVGAEEGPPNNGGEDYVGNVYW